MRFGVLRDWRLLTIGATVAYYMAVRATLHAHPEAFVAPLEAHETAMLLGLFVVVTLALLAMGHMLYGLFRDSGLWRAGLGSGRGGDHSSDSGDEAGGRKLPREAYGR